MRIRNVFSAMLLTIPLGLASTAAFATPTPEWMQVDAKNETVQLNISMGEAGAAGGFNFNGYANGQMTVTVPKGWTVKIKADDVDKYLSHSLEIVDAQDKPPVQALAPAFPKAETPDPKTGIKPSQMSSFTFKADKPGEYWIMCGVPGHALGGMWDKLVVSESAVTPSASMHKAS